MNDRITSTGAPAEEPPAAANILKARLSADPVLAGQVAELLTDLDATSDTYPGDNSAYWDEYNQRVAAALERQPGDSDGAAQAALAADDESPNERAGGGAPVLAAETAAWLATEAAATARWLPAQQIQCDEAATSDDVATGMTAEQSLGALTPHQAAREAFREAQADASSTELGDLFNAPEKEPPGQARAADAVATAHQAVADTQRLTAERVEQGPAVRWLAANDQAGTAAAFGDDVELGSRDEALPPF